MAVEMDQSPREASTPTLRISHDSHSHLILPLLRIPRIRGGLNESRQSEAHTES